MSQILVHRGPAPADQFMVVSNAFMRGQLPVPLRALPRVLLGYFLSCPPGWRVTREKLEGSVLEGRDAVNKALDDLEKAGYLARTRRRGERGTWDWTYSVTDDPKARPLAKAQVGPCPENPSTVEPGMAGPEMDSQAIRTEDGVKKEEKTPAALASEPVLDLDLPEPSPPEQAEDKPLTVNQRAVKLAQAHYERLGGMGNIAAWVQIIRKALERDFQDAAVDAALAWIADRRWAVTEERLAHTLRGGPRPAGRTAPALKPTVRTGPDGRGPELEY